jgi:hypothetical protein
MTTTTDATDQRPQARRPLPDPAVWDDPPMRQALTDQDITTVYRLLSRLGYSQQHIAALTGQSQPEVSSIIHGRKVMAYDVLARIADGLGIPRGYLGLSWCTCHTAGAQAAGAPAGPGQAG